MVSIFFPFMFVLRRLLFVGFSMGLSKWPVFQLQAMFYVVTTNIIYLIWYWPFQSNFFTLIEVMNEVTALFMLYFMLSFSDWNPSPENRYTYGWFFIAICATNLIVHLFFLVRSLGLQFKLWCKKMMAKKKAAKAAKVQKTYRENKDEKDCTLPRHSLAPL